MARPKTDRSDAIKVGYKILPVYVDKVEKLSVNLGIDKSRVIEKALDSFSARLPFYTCECGVEFQSASPKRLCAKCEFDSRC